VISKIVPAEQKNNERIHISNNQYYFRHHTGKIIFVSHSNNLLDYYIIYQNSVVSLLKMFSKRHIVYINY